jgi:hypothetical protein
MINNKNSVDKTPTKLFFLIGLPRSGKSSFGKKWVDRKINILENNLYTENNLCTANNICVCKTKVNPRVIVCADDIRLSLGHRWNGHIEDYVHAIKMTMIKTLLQKHDVLVDGTHTTEKSIRDLLNIDNNAIPYILPTTPQICKIRATETHQEDLCPIIDRMWYNLLKLADIPLVNNISYNEINKIFTFINGMREKSYKPEIRD